MSSIFRITLLLCCFELVISPLAHGQAKDGAVSDSDWVTAVMAPNGTWGIASNSSSNNALAMAMSQCKAKLGLEIGCGAQSVRARDGWIVGARCGHQNILVSGETFADAMQAAMFVEIDLRLFYVPDLPQCQNTFVVNPQGVLVKASAEWSLR